MIRGHQWYPGGNPSFFFSDDDFLQRDVEGSFHPSSHFAATVTTIHQVLGQLSGSFPGGNIVIVNITYPDRFTVAYAVIPWLG